MADRYFTEKTLDFLQQLSQNNNRDWFNDHKSDYEGLVRQPALAFINDMADPLAAISPHFRAISKKVGGSLMRVHRDVRFSKNKQPYKTNIGIQFRHAMGKDVHAPGFYLHIDTDECFLGVGSWHPDSKALARIRETIDDSPGTWRKLCDDKRFNPYYELVGDSLSRPPRGYAKDHPLLTDLKRKDFLALHHLPSDQVTANNLVKTVADGFGRGQGLMRFLCHALSLQY
jgi:uncharacterized protein (TIGR02453 family)